MIIAKYMSTCRYLHIHAFIYGSIVRKSDAVRAEEAAALSGRGKSLDLI